MSLAPSLKKTLFLSFLGHLGVFLFFSFSLGPKMLRPKYPQIYGWGAFFDTAESFFYAPQIKPQEGFWRVKLGALAVKTAQNTEREYRLISDYHLKPTAILAPSQERAGLVYKAAADAAAIGAGKPLSIMFYPTLPPHFLLYFKDRQRVHMELSFNITAGNKINPIALKRKISSGNLEADLLSMRYISHYLFIQQASFPSGSWQVVKIDLCAK